MSRGMYSFSFMHLLSALDENVWREALCESLFVSINSGVSVMAITEDLGIVGNPSCDALFSCPQS